MKRIVSMTTALMFVCAMGSAVPAFAEHGKNNKPGNNSHHHQACQQKPLHFYMDTHDKVNGTFPAGITPEQFEGFYALYEKAMFEECVIPVRVHVAYEDGKAFCLTMAPDIESVKRAHAKVGLPYDAVSEVFTATPGDTFFRAQ